MAEPARTAAPKLPAAARSALTGEPAGGNGSPATGGSSSSDSGHVTIAGRKVSYDSVAIVAGGLLGTWLLLRSRSGSSSQVGSVVAVPTAPSSAQQVDSSALGLPPSSAAPTPGPDLVQSLYGQVLNRVGDPSGSAYWESYSATHTSDQTTAAFLSTPEAQVQTDYQTSLGRYADPGGLQYFTGQITSGQKTAAQVQAEIAWAAAHGSH